MGNLSLQQRLPADERIKTKSEELEGSPWSLCHLWFTSGLLKANDTNKQGAFGLDFDLFASEYTPLVIL